MYGYSDNYDIYDYNIDNATYTYSRRNKFARNWTSTRTLSPFVRDCHNVYKLIKHGKFIPRDSGALYRNIKGKLLNKNTYVITFGETKDRYGRNYVPFLEEGTKYHNIPFAFVGKGNYVYWEPYKDGQKYLMGVGGRFHFHFHPGSTKHKGFIGEESVNTIINYFRTKYNGEVR